MATTDSRETIQTLFEAEEKAKEVVEAAKKERDERLKKATLEAEAEIKAYREEREKLYQAELAKFQVSSGDVTKQVLENEEKEIALIRQMADAKKEEIANQLVAWVTNVDTEA